MKKYILFFLIIGSIFTQSGCKSWSNTAKGGAVGAGVGGAAGGMLGKRSGNTVTGAILGAAIGGVAGAAVGRYMDRQSTKLERELGKDAKVERVGEGIRITFDSGILFAVNKSDLNAAAQGNLRKLAGTLGEFPDTNVLIEGHTDSSGSENYNQTLSEKRAASVGSYLSSLGVSGSRLMLKGYGETQPLADNQSEAGRKANRRVELAIYANDDLKEKAKKGQI